MNLEYWFPWYPFRHQAKTEHLSCLEDGAYRRLIDRYMINRRPLMDNDIALARIAGLTADEWAAIAGTVRAFFLQNGGELSQPTCDEVLDRQDETSRTRSQSAQNAANARWNRRGGSDASRMRGASDPHTPRNAENMHEEAIGENKIKEKNPSVVDTERVVSEGEPIIGDPSRNTISNARESRKSRARAGLSQGWEPESSVVEWSVTVLEPFGIDWRWELDKFRDHAAANDRLCRDWTAAFKNWIRDTVERQKRANGRVQGGRFAGDEKQGRGIVAASIAVGAAIADRTIADQNRRQLAIEQIRKGIPCPWLTDRFVQGLFSDGVVSLEQCRKAGFYVEAAQ